MNIARARQAFAAVPDLLDYKTLLYIGASKARVEMLSYFIKKNYEITIMEAWTENVLYYRQNSRFNIIQADVRNVNKLLLGNFDVVMWWHGPEHVEKDLLPDIFSELFKHTKKVLMLACPWGRYIQQAVRGNPYEVHRSHLYPEFFKELGFKTSTLGRRDRRGSNLIAWRRK